MKLLDRLWQHVQLLKATLFSWLFPLVIGVALSYADQGQDLLQQLVEWDAASPNLPPLVLPMVGVVLLGVAAWYMGRVILSRPPDKGGIRIPERHEVMRKWYPRSLGSLSALFMSGAFLRAAHLARAESFEWYSWLVPLVPLAVGGFGLPIFSRHEDNVARHPLRWAGGAIVVSLFAWLLVRLLPTSDPVPGRLAFLALVSGALAFVIFVFFIWRRTLLRDAEGGPLDHAPRSLKRGTIRTVAGLLVASWVIGAAVTLSPVGAGVLLGAVFLVFFTGAVWISTFSAAQLVRDRFRVPIFSLFVLWLFGASWLNDYHVIEAHGAWPAVEDSLDQRIARWSADHHAGGPLIIVVGEGGGVRAAYWTGLTLATLHESDPAFTDHLFAMSTVSGSSLGGAAFLGLLHEASPECGTMSLCIDRILERDFLSPLLGMALTSDVFGKFLPLSVFDRSRGIEAAFEAAWERAVGTERFGLPLTEGLPETDTLPALYMNVTRVESGEQMLLGTAPWFGEPERDLRSHLPGPPTVAGAAHTSARFPIASPAGRVDTASGGGARAPWGRLVDGGYYEVSGAAQAVSLIRRLCEVDSTLCADRRIVAVAVLNDPKVLDLEPDDGLTELFTPARTLFRAREARANESLRELLSLVGEDRYHELRLCRRIPMDLASDPDGASRQTSLPLGWRLSERAQSDMQAHLSEASNVAAMKKVIESVGGTMQRSASWSCDGAR